MMLAIYREASQQEVLRCLAEGLQWLFGPTESKITGRSGISQARTRVGWEPLQKVFDICAKPLAKPNSGGCFYRGWRITAMDGTVLSVDDCEENDSFFGRSKNQNGKAAFPQARVVGLVECGTHAIFGLSVGKYLDSEVTLALNVLPKLTAGMICLADRLFMSFDLFKRAKDTGAELLFRARMDRQLRREEELEDGSYLSTIFDSQDDRKHEHGMRVRVIEYEVIGSSRPETYRLITTVLDWKEAPAEELAALYRERWEFETTLDEVKTHLNDNSEFLRSRAPKLVIQEIYGLFMAHYAIRAVMCDAADSQKLDPDDLSFVHAIRVVRRRLPTFGTFSPSTLNSVHSRRDSSGARVVQSRPEQSTNREETQQSIPDQPSITREKLQTDLQCSNSG
jgi:hypothetical protein